jgi:hypothetical protein
VLLDEYKRPKRGDVAWWIKFLCGRYN